MLMCSNCGRLSTPDPTDDVDHPCERCGAHAVTEAVPGACRVTGRGRFRAVASVTGADEVSLRLDDDRCSEFWCEVLLTREQLVDLLRQMDESRRTP